MSSGTRSATSTRPKAKAAGFGVVRDEPGTVRLGQPEGRHCHRGLSGSVIPGSVTVGVGAVSANILYTCTSDRD
ncbi:hypothetical protein TR51_18880 [Kitasatospora griseola]|uniref:Uncharacterized protein n=1 Tax=Kitasatospora griseola TaxID=2064 RepID=A0A0D0Q4E8_KITGR|nr:hypothetical protein TR51_18880 [Kitasatospora griseola]